MSFYDEVQRRVFHLLDSELPSYLVYHAPHHTRYVLKQAVEIATFEKVYEEDILLIKLAALFHDTGFIRTYHNHEEAGCELAREFLRTHVTEEQIDQVCDLIMVTKVPQEPETLNERIMADADLDYLGTDLFIPWSELLFKELNYLDPHLDEDEFKKLQIEFLKNHRYHTVYGRSYREHQKQVHLHMLLNGSKD